MKESVSRRVSKLAVAALFLLAAPLAIGAQSSRTLTIQNQCPQTVWIGVNGTYTQACGAGNTCPAGQACLTSRNPPGCFWTLPTPTGGSLQLAKNQSTTFTIPAQSGVQWSGNAYGSTGCDSNNLNCQTGCTGSQPCPSGVGPVGPTTLAEFTLLPNGNDTYDISMINGVNLPIEMAPTSGQSFGTAPSPPLGDYWCGAPGSPTASNSALQGCSWTFNPVVNKVDNSAFLQMVLPGGAACTKNSDCTTAPQVCGLSLGVPLQQTCGNQVGWWTAFEVCGQSSSFGAPFNCTEVVRELDNGTLVQTTKSNLYQCNGPNSMSCYNSNSSVCCGCPQWAFNNNPVVATASCESNNPNWQRISKPWAGFVKQACPTAYSFSHDDATSTFSCTSSGVSPTSPNTVNYTITYCPGGNTGLPAAGAAKRKAAAKPRPRANNS